MKYVARAMGVERLASLLVLVSVTCAFAPLMATAEVSDPTPAQAGTASTEGATAPADSPASTSADQQGWAVSCAAAARAGVLNCAAEQKLIAQETGQTISGVSVGVPGDTRQPSLVFLLPFGLYFPAGVKAQVDQGEATDLIIQTCEPMGCFASAPSTESLLAAMVAGNTLEISGVTTNNEPFRVVHPLRGLAVALGAIK